MTHLLNFSECCAPQDETTKAIAIIREALHAGDSHAMIRVCYFRKVNQD
jgi:hypothetical protein